MCLGFCVKILLAEISRLLFVIKERSNEVTNIGDKIKLAIFFFNNESYFLMTFLIFLSFRQHVKFMLQRAHVLSASLVGRIAVAGHRSTF